MTGLRIPVFVALVITAISPWPQAQTRENLTPSNPIRCKENEDLVVRGRLIETDGNGLEILGNCDVVLEDSRIVAGGIGVLVSNNGEVSISNCYIEGSTAGILAENLAEAYYRDSTIRGGVRATNLAELHDEGGNEVQGRTATAGTNSSAGSAVRVEGVEITGEGVQVGSGGAGVVVTEQGVQVGSVGTGVVVTDKGVVVGGRQEVTIGDDGSVQVDSGGSRVVVEGDYVRVESPGSTVHVSGDWRDHGSSTYRSSDTDRILVELGATSKDGQLQLNLAGDVLFDFGSSAIRPDSAVELRKVAHAIRERSAGTIFIIGHTDSVGEDRQNQQLSEARAVAVISWMNANEKIPLAMMRGRGIGSKNPIAYNTMPDGSDNPEGRAQNRRVEIRFASEGS